MTPFWWHPCTINLMRVSAVSHLQPKRETFLYQEPTRLPSGKHFLYYDELTLGQQPELFDVQQSLFLLCTLFV